MNRGIVNIEIVGVIFTKILKAIREAFQASLHMSEGAFRLAIVAILAGILIVLAVQYIGTLKKTSVGEMIKLAEAKKPEDVKEIIGRIPVSLSLHSDDIISLLAAAKKLAPEEDE
jgi:hypothetical protein